jgi:uncharacterized membrane protein YhiD involved in acid resistance
MKYATLNDDFSDKSPTIGKLCGLKTIVIIDFGAAMVCLTLTGSFSSTASQKPDL